VAAPASSVTRAPPPRRGAAELLLEIGVIKSKPENMDTLFDTTYIK
jgi:hypothetical protein